MAWAGMSGLEDEQAMSHFPTTWRALPYPAITRRFTMLVPSSTALLLQIYSVLNPSTKGNFPKRQVGDSMAIYFLKTLQASLRASAEKWIALQYAPNLQKPR